MIMGPKPLKMNPNYLALVRGTRELHQLLAAGKDDSPEADVIRDATDGPWEALSEGERNRVRNLSEDLYSLVEPPPAAQPMNPEAQAKLNEAFEAKQRGEWDRALDLLRRWRAYFDRSFEECRKLCERALGMNGSPAVMSEVSEWMAIAQAGLGFPVEMVLATFENAIRLDPSNERAKRNLAAFQAASKSIAVKDLEIRSVGAVRTSGLAERRFATAA